jgi:hypothetical protein
MLQLVCFTSPPAAIALRALVLSQPASLIAAAMPPQLQEHPQLPHDNPHLQQQQQQQQQPPQQQQDQQQLLQVCVSRAEDPPGFQVLVTLPGCCLDDVRITAWDDGRLLLRVALHPAAAAAAAVPHDVQQDTGPHTHAHEAQVMERLVQLPGRIAASTAGALMTHNGQLYVRVNDASC